MARPGMPVSDKHAPSGSELATPKMCCLDDLEGIQAWCAGEAAKQTSECEDAGKRTYCPPQLVSTWNKLLWGARLELRQTVREGLSLVSFSQPFLQPTNAKVLQATTLVQKLLSTHHCLTALDIDTDSFKGSEARFCDALRGNCFIRFLKMNINTFALHKDIYSAITSLPNLKEVDCPTDCECPVQFSAALAKLLRTSTKLTALRIPKLYMNGTGAVIFLPALVGNSTLEELSFHSSAISEARPEHRGSFAKFLADAKVLKKLAVGAYNEVRQLSLKWVLRGLLRNTVLSEITLEDFIVDADSADIMTDVLGRNRALRVLNILSLTYDAWMSRAGGSTTSCQTDFNAWLPALAVNETLQRVTLPLRIWKPEQWAELFLSLSLSARPFKLIIKGHCSERYLWEKLCGALRRTGMEEQVSFDTTLYILDKHEMLDCKAFSKFHSFPYQDDREEVSRIFRRLPSFTHVTTAHLEICIPDVDETLSSDIAHYIATTSVLKELHLTIWLRQLFPEAAMIGWSAILESLRRNTSVNELCVVTRFMSDPEIQLLADTLNSCENIRRIHVGVGDADVAAAFVRRMCDEIECNYSLLRLTVDGCALSRCGVSREWFGIWDTTRRNSDLIARAALYLNRTLVDRYGAEALERIGKHPSLQQEVAQLLSTSEADAAALVRTELMGIQSLDGFMRASGVVKDSVSCDRREDGHLQLDDLNEDCWSLIRRHLKVEDVSDPAATALIEDSLPNVMAAA
ncbi:hypothetical protein HPB52_011616 [Rhipicephalus sanguineus]|uniref:Nlr family card domain protein n=1 Tax=Rhipicephalus sanguineus TaxID=34632 RepID=A0A9D4PJ46_RHISA|nr:hypothetical protein HPB52_011616 [Rhipicephalus sanguineus]